MHNSFVNVEHTGLMCFYQYFYTERCTVETFANNVLVNRIK